MSKVDIVLAGMLNETKIPYRRDDGDLFEIGEWVELWADTKFTKLSRIGVIKEFCEFGGMLCIRTTDSNIPHSVYCLKKMHLEQPLGHPRYKGAVINVMQKLHNEGLFELIPVDFSKYSIKKNDITRLDVYPKGQRAYSYDSNEWQSFSGKESEKYFRAYFREEV